LDWLEQKHIDGKHYNCIAHNGARFDFYLLIKELQKNEMLHTDLNLRGTSVIKMKFNNHTFQDPCCFMPASLSSLCKAFKVKTPKLESFTLENGETLNNTELCFYKKELTFNGFLNLQIDEPEFWKLYVDRWTIPASLTTEGRSVQCRPTRCFFIKKN